MTPQRTAIRKIFVRSAAAASGLAQRTELLKRLPCIWPVAWNHREVIELLLARGADPDARDAQRGQQCCTSPPFKAALNMVSCLLNAGADVHAVDESGKDSAALGSKNQRSGSGGSPPRRGRADPRQEPKRRRDSRTKPLARASWRSFGCS